MRPENLYFGGGPVQTVLSPVVLIALLVAGWFICFGTRRKALAAFLAAVVLIPTDQVLVTGFLHFPALRIVAVFGLFRALRSKIASKETVFSGGVSKIDKAVLASLLLTAIAGVLLWREMGALVYQVGNLVTYTGLYLTVRLIIRNEEDVGHALKAFVVISGIVAAVMTYEQLTGHNPYGLLGGARAFAYATVVERGEKLRAVASFGHPILAGTFGAIQLPVLCGLWWKGKAFRRYAVIGAVAAITITLASASATPLMALGAGILGLCLWPLRGWMRQIRWGLLFTIISLHMVMKAPVWQLIARIDIVGGSSGEHRYQLVDQFIQHFSEWWLIGTTKNADWGWGMWDTCNQFVATGVSAGLVPFVLLIAVIVYAFKFLGRARISPGVTRNDALFLWSLSVGVFANVVAFFGIQYFDQTIIAWYGLLAIAIAMANSRRRQELLFIQRKKVDATAELTSDASVAIASTGEPSKTSYANSFTDY